MGNSYHKYVEKQIESAQDLTDGKRLVLKKVLREGSGDKTPPPKSYATVYYEGRLMNGKIFDASTKETFTFMLNNGSVIQGWDLAVSTMKKGEESLVIIAPEYGYKNAKKDKIPANSTLIFKIQLLGITVTET
jgi:FKBP-type peptidyl-prolyl cis-trans isomerase